MSPKALAPHDLHISTAPRSRRRLLRNLDPGLTPRGVVCMLGALMLFGSCGSSDETKTHSWAPADEPFRMTLPVAVTPQPGRDSGTMKTRQWKSAKGAIYLEIAIVTLPAGMLESGARPMMNKFVDNGIKTAGATLSDRKESALSGYPMVRARSQKGGEHMQTLVLGVPPKMLAVVASTTDESAKPRLDAMMASLKLEGIPDYAPPEGK